MGKCEKAFTELKNYVLATPAMRGPNFSLPFHIVIDASNTIVGVVLG